MAKRHKHRDPLFVEVVAALGAGNISEGYILDRRRGNHRVRFFGYCDTHNGKIVINPAAALLDALIEELVHRMRPSWSERAVKSRTTKLIRSLTHDEIERLFTIYESVKTKRATRAHFDGIYDDE